MEQSPRARSKRGWALYALAWLPAAGLYAIAVATVPEVRWWHGLISGTVVMSMAALEGVLVWHLTARVPLQPFKRFRFALTHLVAAASYSAVWSAGIHGWVWLVAGGTVAWQVFAQSGVWQFVTGFYIYALIAGFSYLLRTQQQLRERETAAARAQAAAARAQLQSVRANLNPHFLFNALHALGSLVRVDPAGADRAIERLGELLRRSLDHGNRDLVPLAEEWAFARSYLELEQLRLGERLHLQTSLETDALDVLVPPFLLQPLVENAVRHGIAPRPQGGTLSVSAARRNGALHLRIADDGAGSAPQRLSPSNGFGLEGVKQQLEASYGPRARLEIQTAADQGFAVSIDLPINP
jgi:hypothetical protein